MIGRESSLALGIDLVTSGASVDVVGGRGSGRSAFLGALRGRLLDLEWRVITVHGVAPLRQHPFAAMQLAGIGGERRGVSPLVDTVDALREATAGGRSVIFLDDWDDLDESSWGAAEAVRRIHGVPIVRSRLKGLRARHSPTGQTAAALDDSFVIELTPLRYEDLERVLTAHLGGPLDSGTMGRIFAKSGGIVGLARNLVDACVRDGRLVNRPDAGWVATRDLWSPGIRSILEAHVEALSDPERDALEVLALTGAVDIDTARSLVDWSLLEMLEERQLVALVGAGPREMVAVIPPLVVEYFRHEPLSARRTRLTDHIAERIGNAHVGDIAPARLMMTPPPLSDEALFARLVQERIRARALVTAAEWERSPSTETATPYIYALLHTSHLTARAQIDRVLTGTDPASGDELSRAEYLHIRAHIVAGLDGDIDGALELLARDTPLLGDYAGMAVATEVEILTYLRGVPDDLGRLGVDDGMPTPVRIALLRARQLALVALARFEEALEVDALLEPIDVGPESWASRVLTGYALAGTGRMDAAVELLECGYEAAYNAYDTDALKAFGAALALCHVLRGDYEPIERMLDTLFSAGEPSPYPPAVQITLWTLAAIVSVRRGNIVAAERFLAELGAHGNPDGPLPGQSSLWARLQMMAFEGEGAQAAVELWEHGERAWQYGARFAAAISMLCSIEITRDAQALAIARERVGALIEAPVLLSHLHYVEALVAGDPDALMAVVDELLATGKTGLAIAAYENAAVILRGRGDGAGADDALARAAALRAAQPEAFYDSVRFGALTVTLTDREKQIARLAAQGLSNPEIATRLVLSVRTVESHLHRVMRKLDVHRRGDLGRFLETTLAA